MSSDTSLKCYHEIKREGLLGRMQEMVYDCVHNNPDVTDKDIAEMLSLSINCVTPRRGELVDMGLVYCSGTVKQLNGRSARVWRLVKREVNNKLTRYM